jgi:hypothetical protein
LPEIDLQHLAHVFNDDSRIAQEIADGAVAVAGCALGGEHRLIHVKLAAGEAA